MTRKLKSEYAPICKAIGCTRATRSPTGYCFQHTGMHCVEGRTLIKQEKAARRRRAIINNPDPGPYWRRIR